MLAELLPGILAANAARAAGALNGGEAGRRLEQRFRCEHWLAAYGTLRPGSANHHLLANCRGDWLHGLVCGHRIERSYPEFWFVPDAAPEPVATLHSPDLPAIWPLLDEFEGTDYRRILVPVRLASGWQVANLYASLLPPP